MARILYIEIDILQKNANEKCKSSQGPKVGPGPRPILARFARPTPLRYVGKISRKFLPPPLDQILDPLLAACLVIPDVGGGGQVILPDWSFRYSSCLGFKGQGEGHPPIWPRGRDTLPTYLAGGRQVTHLAGERVGKRGRVTYLLGKRGEMDQQFLIWGGGGWEKQVNSSLSWGGWVNSISWIPCKQKYRHDWKHYIPSYYVRSP